MKYRNLCSLLKKRSKLLPVPETSPLLSIWILTISAVENTIGKTSKQFLRKNAGGFLLLRIKKLCIQAAKSKDAKTIPSFSVFITAKARCSRSALLKFRLRAETDLIHRMKLSMKWKIFSVFLLRNFRNVPLCAIF